MATSEKVYFPSVRIKGFKAIDDLNLNSLARINLIAGDNNVGKSTLLEALYILAMEGSINVMVKVACDRMGYSEQVNLEQNEKIRQLLLLSFFKDWKFDLGKSISLQQGSDNELELRLGYACEEEVKEGNGKHFISIRYIVNRQELIESRGEIKKGICKLKGAFEEFCPLEGRWYHFRPGKNHNEVQFIHTSLFSKKLNAFLWNNISLTGLEKYVIEALRIIEPKVENLAFLEETVSLGDSGQQERNPYLTLKDREGRFPLNVMGDGMNRILSLVLGIVNSANGICLIDEVENGIYYRRQPELWKMIGMLAEQLNVQVFVTTHSLDCVRSFADMARGKDAQLIRLEKRAKGITAVCYSAEELQAAISNDIELR